MIYEQFDLTLKNPVINNHRLYGKSLLPGLAYIDLLFQVFRKHRYSYNQLELRNLSIYNPLVVGEDSPVALTIQGVEIKEGQWRIRVEGQEKTTERLMTEKKLYCTAEMFQIAPVVFTGTLDLKLMKQSALKTIDLDQIYRQHRRQELVHTGFMAAMGKVYMGETTILMDLSLGKDALPLADEFMFHPALVDSSAIAAGVLPALQFNADEQLFLPLFYESFQATALLQRQCVTWIQTSSVERKNELISLTLEFYDESGKQVAILKNFSAKLVREAELLNTNRKEKNHITKSTLLPKQPTASHSGKTALSVAIENFLRQLLAERLNKPAAQIKNSIGYYEMGLDSPGLLEIVHMIETKTEIALSPTLLFEYTTIADLAAFLARNYPVQFSLLNAMDPDLVPVPTDNAVAPTLLNSRTEPDNIHPSPSTLQTSHFTLHTSTDVAIIGMAGRYPLARNLAEFWANLKEGKDCISEIPKSRWDWHRFEGLCSPSGKELSRWGGFIDDPECFDPAFFRISPRETLTIDPQERLFLEVCWEVIEDAGYTPQTLVLPWGRNQRSQVGVYVGVMNKDYNLSGADLFSHGDLFPVSLNEATIANRVSYFCNFHGPSMTVDTLCSASLTAVHLAVQSIKSGECEAALAGGVNLSLHPYKYLIYGTRDMLASDAYCHTFGKGGDGYVPSEGVGAVLLKPLPKAIQDGDHIYAVIKGSVINHGGNSGGITVPNVVSQADMIESCLAKTGINPRTISFVEAHGTGTSLGDPIEIQGLMKAFHYYTESKQFCAIGSVKSNIGHAEAAAGISGLHKTALQIFNKTLVPSLHSEELNPHIDFIHSPFYVQHQTVEWKQPVAAEDDRQAAYPRRAGLSALGAYGSNAYFILEEYIPEAPREQIPSYMTQLKNPVIIPLSARNMERLQAYAKKLQTFLQPLAQNHDSAIHLAEIAYTLQAGREAMEERVAFLARDIPDLIEKLAAFAEGKKAIANCWRGQTDQDRETINFSSTDQESAALIATWMAKGNLKKIAAWWVKGYPIPWEQFYGAMKPCRMSLPTYPFAKERYGMPSGNRMPVGDGTDKLVGTHHEIVLTGKENNLRYTEVEKSVSAVWGKELGLTKVNVNDNFIEMGGNSMIAIKLEVELGKIGLFIDHLDIYQHPSVAELASFICQETNDDMVMNKKLMDSIEPCRGGGGEKVLDNITPFNDIYYRNCFYNALFPVINHFDKDITPVLINDAPVYSCPPDKEPPLLANDYKSLKTIEQLLKEQHITSSNKIHSDNIISDIVSGISKNRPIIIAVDCFYVPMRADLYQKIHWRHMWLVYGYDDSQQIFHIIEHKHRGSLTYKKHVVGYQDLVNSYNGHLSNFPDNREPTYFEFYLDDTMDLSGTNIVNDYGKIFAANMAHNKQHILEGLTAIKLFEAAFKTIVFNEVELKKNIDEILEMLNGIIDARRADMYKIKLLYKEKDDILGLLNKVIDTWDAIRLKLARCMFKSIYDAKSIAFVIERLGSIYDYELEYYSLYMPFLEAQLSS